MGFEWDQVVRREDVDDEMNAEFLVYEIPFLIAVVTASAKVSISSSVV